MKLTLALNSSLFARLQASAIRDGKTINAAILEGIGAYIEAEESANADSDASFGSGSLVSGLN